MTGKPSHNAGYLNETYKRSRRPKITLMRIKKSPYSQSKSQNKFKISPFKSKKDFQIRTYRNGQKDQHKWDKTRRKKKRKENTHTCSINNSDSLSLLKGPSTVTHYSIVSTTTSVDFVSSLVGIGQCNQ